MKNAIFEHLIKFDDIYFISKLIKNINKNFELVYNLKTERYLIVDANKKQICITFDHYPDSRVLDKLEQTKVENANKLFKEIETHNQKLEEQKNQSLQDLAYNQLNEVVNFATKTTYDLSQNQIRKIINTEVNYD